MWNWKLDYLREYIEQRHISTLNFALACYSNTAMNAKYADLLRLLLCYAIVFNCEGTVDQGVLELFKAINVEEIENKHPKDY